MQREMFEFDFEHHDEPSLTPEQLKYVIDHMLDLTHEAVARLLGLHRDGSIKKATQTVREMVAGKRRISGPVTAALWFACKVDYGEDWPRDWPLWFRDT